MKIMRILAVMVFSIVGSLGFAYDVEDKCISFSTKGPDRYADGSIVLDGECYALVWSADGVFEGFNAQGESIDTNDVVVLAAALAKDGRCPPVLFQLPVKLSNSLSRGSYAVYLVDTRVVRGEKTQPSAVKGGKIVLVNGYGAVSASISVKENEELFAASEAGGGANGQVAGELCAAPRSCVQPKVKSMRVDDTYVYLTVENLKGYMRVHGGNDLKAMNSTGAAVETSGESAETVLIAPKGGTSGFYRVIRNEAAR